MKTNTEPQPTPAGETTGQTIAPPEYVRQSKQWRKEIDAAIARFLSGDETWRLRVAEIQADMREADSWNRERRLADERLHSAEGQDGNDALTSLQEAVMWLGMDLKAYNEQHPGSSPDPYPESKNPDSAKIEPTADGLKLNHPRSERSTRLSHHFPIMNTEPRPTDKELLWREERDQHGNSNFEALSFTWGNEAHEPTLLWRVQCVLKNNEAVWAVDNSALELLDSQPVRAIDVCELTFETHDAAHRWCQEMENELRAILGEGLPPVPAPEPETKPMITDELGFAPTTVVRSHWSRNGGRLHFTRVWKKTDDTGIEQEREITDPEEERECFRGYFKQRMIEEAVTRLVTGGFGRLIWEEQFMTVVMQCEVDFLNVSSITATIRRGGNIGTPEELKIATPTNEEFLRVVARQMHSRQLDLEAKIGNRTEWELRDEIMRSARALGIQAQAPAPDLAADDSGGVLPVTLEDIQAGGGDITKKAGGLF